MERRMGRALHGEEGGALPCLLAMEREREVEWQCCTGEGAPREHGGGRNACARVKIGWARRRRERERLSETLMRVLVGNISAW